MTAQSSDNPVVHPPETGWAQSRVPREKSLRTCVPAVEDRTAPGTRRGPESNIVRGED
ncbi:hypothetical protein [Streptomyces nodosus]|uniref:hypothetical protein n=1 Tax=Streptomyces nodosus TaxID=40318 RepID=UPI000AA5DE82|nr:hypothetical protein [Streptomyces nodosus]MBB4790390.1 hypothetical protein [Streptomyces nodosus]